MYVSRSVKLLSLSRSESQSQTRLALLDAAIELFIDKGVEATSIEEVAASAGFTRGAFYSNFGSKDELFLAAMARFLEALHAAAHPPDDVPADSGVAYRERLERLRGVTGDRASVFLAEVSLYAIRHPAVAEEVAALHQKQLVPAMDFVRASLTTAGIKRSKVPVATLANVAQCLTFSLHFFAQIDPAIDPEESLAIAMDLLFKGLAAPRR
jgi:AcrR family transcriptional regulator